MRRAQPQNVNYGDGRVDIKISLSEENTKILEKALHKSPTPFWKSDKLFLAIQAVALVVGGCWVLVQFIVFERDKISLDAQHLKAQIELARLEAEKGTIQAQQMTLDLNNDKNRKFKAERSIEPAFVKRLDDNTALYNLTYYIRVTNESKQPLEVSMWVLDYFTGKPSNNLEELAEFISPIGYPENRWNTRSDTDGSVAWTRTGSHGAVFSAAQGNIELRCNAAVDDVTLANGGGLTGTLSPGQSYSMSEDFLVKATPGTYVAFVQSICFERGKENDSLYHTSQYQMLPPPPTLPEMTEQIAMATIDRVPARDSGVPAAAPGKPPSSADK